MSKTTKYILGVAFLVMFIALAVIGYKYLSENYDPDDDISIAESTAVSVPASDSSNPAESKSEESNPAESKPAESKPEESKPVESKPVESKPEESKPVESKPVESKPVESKPEESKSAESKPEESKPEESKSVDLKTDDFTVLDANGNEVSLSDFAGKPIVVNFWATWCGPCRSELPAFDKLHKEYGDDVVFLMVNLTDGARETIEGVKRFTTNEGYTFPVYYDTKYSASYAYGVYSIPLTLFINADGTLDDSHIGSMSEKTLNNYILKIKGEN